MIRRALVLSALALVASTLPACSSLNPSPSDGKIKVVTSTDVWDSVAQAVGGDAVDVKSIISNSSADPHSYVSTPSDAAEISQADLVVFNGGGYDPFMEKDLSNNPGKRTVQATNLQPDFGQQETNEHVWYNFDTAKRVAKKIGEELGAMKADRKDYFARNAENFANKVDGLAKKVADIATAHKGTKVIITEPVAHYLLQAAALNDVTPEKFVIAIEEETDPPADSIAEVEQLISSHQVAVLIRNPQTETPVTQHIIEQAKQAAVPIVDMSETRPEGEDYLQWMDEQIESLAAALKQQ